MRQKKTSDATEPKLPVVSDSSGDERDNSALDAARQNQSSITSEQILTRFDLFLEAASEGIYDWSLETAELWVSQRFSEIFNLEAPAITPKAG